MTKACRSTCGSRRRDSDPPLVAVLIVVLIVVFSMTAASSPSSATSSATLTALLSHPAIWRGDDCAPEPSALSSRLRKARCRAARPRLAAGCADRNAAGARRHRRNPPYVARPRARAGTSAATWCGSRRRWSPMRRHSPRRASISRGCCRALPRAAGCAVGFRPGSARTRMRRRVRVADHARRARVAPAAVAAREGRTWGVLWRRPGQRGGAAAAPLRLALSPHAGQLAVHVLKRRGATLRSRC